MGGHTVCGKVEQVVAHQLVTIVMIQPLNGDNRGGEAAERRFFHRPRPTSPLSFRICDLLYLIYENAKLRIHRAIEGVRFSATAVSGCRVQFDHATSESLWGTT